jgi:cation diffusion facilitator family transporter
MEGHSTKHVVQSLVVNLAIAIAKGGAAFFTGSGAMLAEAIHSAADSGNQLLLLVGIKRAAKPPDEHRPLGYGRAMYFWSFVVALLLFTGGGVFSIYEGIHKLEKPEMPENVVVGLAILGFSLALEGASTLSNIRELNKRRGPTPFWRYLRDSKDSDLVVVFGENAAASLGLIVAMGALGATMLTHNPVWDSVGTLLIGVVLVAVAIFLGVEIISLLEGESADEATVVAAREVAAEQKAIRELIQIIAVQQGPGEVLMAVKVSLHENLTVRDACDAINAFEAAVRARRPEVKWMFVEPDFPKAAVSKVAASS